MPDFERLIDSLSIHIADTPEEKAYMSGFIAGKRKARLEILVIFSVMFTLLLLAIWYCI